MSSAADPSRSVAGITCKRLRLSPTLEVQTLLVLLNLAFFGRSSVVAFTGLSDRGGGGGETFFEAG